MARHAERGRAMEYYLFPSYLRARQDAAQRAFKITTLFDGRCLECGRLAILSVTDTHPHAHLAQNKFYQYRYRMRRSCGCKTVFGGMGVATFFEFEEE
jgi:hypothetical protein